MRATPGLNVETRLSVATAQQISLLQGSCENFGNVNLDPPPLTFDQFRMNGFDVDWCRYSQTENLDSEVTGTTPSQAPPTTGRATPTEGERFYVLIIVAVVVGVVIIVCTCMLACVFFTSRKQS